MKYFKLLPVISYGNAELRNIFNKYVLQDAIEPKYLFTRLLSDNESLEDIAYDEYGDAELWWVLAIINDIRDVVFDLSIDEDSLQIIAREMSTTDGILDTILYIENYELLQAENDLKRNLKILKDEFINQFLSDILKARPSII